GWRDAAASPDYAENLWKSVRLHQNYSIALEMANAVMAPEQANDFGINAGMKDLNGPTEWVTIKPSQGEYYSHVTQLYNSQLSNNPIDVSWIWQDSSGNYFMTLTYNQVKRQCEPLKPEAERKYCNLTGRNSWEPNTP
ncbi:MAG: hypothetical protein GY816_11620, partial [Cytophagales bacterium]|nr:hypothetical protein [Cytophagales bacterium]